MELFIRCLITIAFSIIVFILCYSFLHFEFYSSGLWWTLFFLLGLAEFTAIFGRQGAGTISPLLNLIGNLAGFIIVILSFIFFWWQGGVGMLVASLLWLMFMGSISLIIHGAIRHSNRE